MSSHIRLPLLGTPPSSPESAAELWAGSAPDSVSALAVLPVAGACEDKLLQVGDLARETGKTVRALHLYEEMDLLRPAARSKGRYRLYGPEALLRIRWIAKLQDIGFSLGDIQDIVKDWERAGSAPHAMEKVRDVYRQKLEETRATLLRLHALESEITASLEYLDACDSTCAPERVVSACKSCDLHDHDRPVPDLVAGLGASPQQQSV